MSILDQTTLCLTSIISLREHLNVGRRWDDSVTSSAKSELYEFLINELWLIIEDWREVHIQKPLPLKLVKKNW